MHAADTSAEVHDRRMAALRRLSAREKLGEVTRLSELTSELAAVGIRLDPEAEFEGADLSIHRITATPEREERA